MPHCVITARLSASFGVSLDRSPRHPPFCVLRTPILALFSFHFYTFLPSFWVPSADFLRLSTSPSSLSRHSVGSKLLAPLWIDFCWIWAPFWLPLGSLLAPFWLPFGSILGPLGGLLVDVGIRSGNCRGPRSSGAAFGPPFWVYFGTNFQAFFLSTFYRFF